MTSDDERYEEVVQCLFVKFVGVGNKHDKKKEEKKEEKKK
jgi:hypothetical protein